MLVKIKLFNKIRKYIYRDFVMNKTYFVYFDKLEYNNNSNIFKGILYFCLFRSVYISRFRY